MNLGNPEDNSVVGVTKQSIFISIDDEEIFEKIENVILEDWIKVNEEHGQRIMIFSRKLLSLRQSSHYLQNRNSKLESTNYPHHTLISSLNFQTKS